MMEELKQNGGEKEAMKKKIILTATILAIATFLASLAQPVLALGYPNYHDWAFYDFGYATSMSGAAGQIANYGVEFETNDWLGRHQEHWVQLTVRYENHYSAEVGLVVEYENTLFYGWMWHTYAYAGYSDWEEQELGGQSVVFDTYDLGWSIDGPLSAQVAVFQQSVGSHTWQWYCDGSMFAEHYFPSYWEGYVVDSCTEAYTQPKEEQANHVIADVTDIYLKNSDTGYWLTPTMEDEGVSAGWMVNEAAGPWWHATWSIRQ